MFRHIYTKLTSCKREILILAVIIFFGIFFRAYHFSDWLHFEIDQTYDARIVSSAVQNGVGNLPLLGPTAGGGRALRLGPAFYYLEFIGAKIFGDTPAGHASIVLIFSILAIHFFYLLCKKYFSVYLSLGLAAIFSASYYTIVYSRFSWSPNVLPFLAIFSFWALLRSVSPEEKRKDLWFLIAATTSTVMTQIHFNAFFIIPAIIISFLLWKRPRFQLKIWLAALAIIFLVYSPVIANEIKTNGENFHLFKSKLEKSSAPAHSIIKSITQDFQYTGSAYFFIFSGLGEINSKKPDSYNMQPTTSNPLWFWLGIILFLTALFLLIRNLIGEKNSPKKDFLVLIFLWFFWSFLYFFSLLQSYRLYPRFFLLASPLAIIFFGIILEKISFGKNKVRPIICGVFILIFIFSNTLKVLQYFNQYQKTSFNSIPLDDVFPNTDRIALRDQLLAADYIQSQVKQNNYPVYIKSLPEIEPALWYHLNKFGISYIGDFKTAKYYSDADYFMVNINKKSGRQETFSDFDILQSKKFGIFTVIQLTPKPSLITEKAPADNAKKEYLQTTQIKDLMTWRKLLLR